MQKPDDLGPLPLIRARESILHNHWLVEHEGIPYWSRIYDGGDVIYKQATLDLAEREAFFLSQLDSPHFPAVLKTESAPLYSVVVLEKIDGTPLDQNISDIRATPETLHRFMLECLAILEELAKQGITHRDIRPDNILVRDHKPVLIDLGWAVSAARPCFTPQFLGGIQRPPDGSFCDVYSMGKVLEQIHDDRNPLFGFVVELMSDSNASTRITDPKKLRTLFDVAAMALDKEGTEYQHLIRILLENISVRNRNLSVLREKNLQHISDTETAKNLLGSSEATVREINAKLEEQQSVVFALREQLETRENHLAEIVQESNRLQSQIAALQSQIAALHAQIAAKEEAITTFTVELHQAETAVVEQQKTIEDLHARVDDLTAELAEQNRDFDVRTKHLETEIEKYEGQLAAQESKIANQDLELEFIKGGTGWAILERIWKARLQVVPRGSRRERWMRRILGKNSGPHLDSVQPAEKRTTVKRRLREMVRAKTPYSMRRIARKIYPSEGSSPPQSIVHATGPAETGQTLWLAEHPPITYDIIVFPIIDWDFRFQRPQQLAVRFSESGHRVFYLNTRFHDAIDTSFRVLRENILEIFPSGPSTLSIYSDCLDDRTSDLIAERLATCFQEFFVKDAVCFIDLPFWTPVAVRLRQKFGWKILYDCMDWHSGFSTNAEQMLELEKELSFGCDILVTTSRKLYAEHVSRNDRCILIPNAVDFNHFHFAPEFRPHELEQVHAPILGYYGAISDWFDSRLIQTLAMRRPEWSFVLIGRTFGADLQPLSGLKNVHHIEEVPYANLPAYLHHFDVCVIPFKKTPLTEATNPVKLFEYLAAGKRVVATDLNELQYYSDYVRLASNPDEWMGAIEKNLQPADPIQVQNSVEFARQNTWEHRTADIRSSIQPLYPKASIVIVTYNNLDYNRICLESIFSKTIYPNFEVIVVDNDSNDGTVEFLREFSQQHPQVKVIVNNVNRGFAAANNQGLREAEGEYIVFLNNDTVVTTGWLSRLIYHLRDPGIGMVGPVTNWSGNESRIETHYESLDRLEEFAEAYTRDHFGRTFEIKMLALFCVAMRRNVFEQVGPLDERYGIGMFEDDDYAFRVKEKGYKILCAEDVFIHHWGRASFSKLADEEYRGLFDVNREKFEEKWKTKWEPHQHRTR